MRDIFDTLADIFSDLGDTLENTIYNFSPYLNLDEVDTFADNIVVLLLSLIIFMLMWRIFNAVLSKTGASEKLQRALSLDEEDTRRLINPVRLLSGVASIFFTLHIMLNGISPTVAASVTRIATALGLISAFWIVHILTQMVGEKPAVVNKLTGLDIPSRLIPYITTLLSWVIAFVGVVIVLQQFDIDISALLAGLGIFGAGLVFTAKSALGDAVAFARIATNNPFETGDEIMTDKVEGIIKEVGISSTTVQQRDGSLISISNSDLMSQPISNISRSGVASYGFNVLLCNQSPADNIQRAIEEITKLLDNMGTSNPLVSIVEIGYHIDLQVEFQSEDTSNAFDNITVHVLDIIQKHDISLACKNCNKTCQSNSEELIDLKGDEDEES